MTYYTLAMRETATTWAIQWGDYCKMSVHTEMLDMKHSNVGAKREDGSTIRATDFKVISSADDQVSINAAIAALNKA